MVDASQIAFDVYQNISLAESLPLLKGLLIYIVGMVIYSIFIFKFYKFAAKRDIFELNLEKHNNSSSPALRKFISVIFYIVEYLIIFPLIAAFWFIILFVLLVFLAKNQAVGDILLLSMAVIAVVRTTAYYNENLSQDLAKMLPFTLLGIFLVDSSYFSLSGSINLLLQFPTFTRAFIYYFFAIVLIEFIARIFYGLYALIFKR